MIVTVIPARGGSRGIAKKNIADVGGRPLIQWTIRASMQSPYVNRTIVTTDDDDVAMVAENCGAEVVNRPKELCADDIHAVHPTIHAVESLDNTPDQVFMLLPTAPFRNAKDIGTGIRYLNNGADAVIGVEPLEKGLNSLRYLTESGMTQVTDTVNVHDQRQKGPLYAVNGALFGAWWSVLRYRQTFHVPDAQPYIMTKLASIDINSYDDLEFARRLAGKLG